MLNCRYMYEKEYGLVSCKFLRISWHLHAYTKVGIAWVGVKPGPWTMDWSTNHQEVTFWPWMWKRGVQNQCNDTVHSPFACWTFIWAQAESKQDKSAHACSLQISTFILAWLEAAFCDSLQLVTCLHTHTVHVQCTDQCRVPDRLHPHEESEFCDRCYNVCSTNQLAGLE